MILKDVSLDSPEENILLDEALFVLADKGAGGEVLRFWESAKTFIVLGRIGKEAEDIHAKAALQDNIPVLRRTSGGGTVVQGPGCLNYTLILSKHTDPAIADLRQSYQWISAKMVQALGDLNIEAEFHPISDIALVANRKKFSGNAQHRGKNYILHHGTILYNFDLSLIPRYLQMPKDRPEYRQNRPHEDFVTNIAINPADFKAAFKNVFFVRDELNLTALEQTTLESLKDKHALHVQLYPQ
jgi:lipoate-protein ligase A